MFTCFSTPRKGFLAPIRKWMAGTVILMWAGSAHVYGQAADYPISAIPFTEVKLTDQFWSHRIETNRKVTIPFGFKKSEEEGRIRNFERAGGLLNGEYEGKMPFDDTDVYKTIEGAAYSLQTNPDPALDTYIDGIIAKIAAAQEPDGYLTTWKTIDITKSPATWVDPSPKWVNELKGSHELYNAGHLYEAAYAHYRATGKRNLLDIALKNADLIGKTFGPGKLQTPPGHQIIETGLVKLYRVTGEKKYLDLARFFLDQRGNAGGHPLFGPYNQDHAPVVDQTEAVGHAVRATYMYSGMADIAALMNDKKYLNAVNEIWENVVAKKMYITGGIGALHDGEAFGGNYELPNLTAYNETCASIASVYWNQRMFLLTGDARYIDVLERTLYNGTISGVSLEGNTFFYPNALASDGKYAFNQGATTRKPWFDCSCCPTNIARFIPSVPDYIYATHGDTLFVNLFMSNTADIPMAGTVVRAEQVTNYPWDGAISIRVNPEKESRFVLNVRIPGWAQGKPVPSDLYRYAGSPETAYSVELNGKPVQAAITRGYVSIDRTWKAGDVVDVKLPMEVRRVLANELVRDDAGRVAIERGPVVYCFEGVDNGGKVSDIEVPDDAVFTAAFKNDFLGGLTVLQADLLENGKTKPATAIPYYAWSHRGPGEMAVWLKRKGTNLSDR